MDEDTISHGLAQTLFILYLIMYCNTRDDDQKLIDSVKNKQLKKCVKQNPFHTYMSAVT